MVLGSRGCLEKVGVERRMKGNRSRSLRRSHYCRSRQSFRFVTKGNQQDHCQKEVWD